MRRLLQRASKLLMGAVQVARSLVGRVSLGRRPPAVGEAPTDLHDRGAFLNHLQRVLDDTSPARPITGALFILDLDRFSLINASCGLRVGDLLLDAVAQRLQGTLARHDVLGSLGGDQFAVCVRALAGQDTAAVIAGNLMRAAGRCLTIQGVELQPSASVGVALLTADTVSPDVWMARADAALRAAKAGGGSRWRCFDASLTVEGPRRLTLDVAVKRALGARQFALAYQPIFSRDGRHIVAAEALLRWQHPEHGAVAPSEFISVLEQNGQIIAVGHWVLLEACRTMQDWVMRGVAPATISVNVSPVQFREATFVEDVVGALRSSGLAADRLQIEMTEALLLDPTPDCLEKLHELTRMGVRLAVDDFGVGYSSLAYLKRFPLHALKIDRLFVRDLPRQVEDAAIVRAIVELSHALALRVTAEGVENGDQHELLQRLGCDAMQGFWFARPMSAEALRHALTAQADERSGIHKEPQWPETTRLLR